MDSLLTATQPTITIVQQTIPISNATYKGALGSAFTSNKYAIAVEVSIMLSIFHESSGVTAEGKSRMQHLYAEVGYDCGDPSGCDYASCRRKIGYGALLFDYLGNAKIAEMIGGNVELGLINALVTGIEHLSLHSYDKIRLVCGKPRLPPKPRVPVTTEAHPETPPQEVLTDDSRKALDAHIEVEKDRVGKYLEEQYAHPSDDTFEFLPPGMHGPYRRRASDEEGAQHISMEHVSIDVSAEASREDILQAVQKLLEMAAMLSSEPQQEPTKAEEQPEEPEDEEATKLHMAQEAERLAAEQAALKAKPQDAPQAASRYRKGTTPTKAK